MGYGPRPTKRSLPAHPMVPESPLQAGLPLLDPTSPIRSRAGRTGKGQWELSPQTRTLFPDPGRPTASSQETPTLAQVLHFGEAWSASQPTRSERREGVN